jgi:hypothetical protein
MQPCPCFFSVVEEAQTSQAPDYGIEGVSGERHGSGKAVCACVSSGEERGGTGLEHPEAAC